MEYIPNYEKHMIYTSWRISFWNLSVTESRIHTTDQIKKRNIIANTCKYRTANKLSCFLVFICICTVLNFTSLHKPFTAQCDGGWRSTGERIVKLGNIYTSIGGINPHLWNTNDKYRLADFLPKSICYRITNLFHRPN